MKQRPREMSDSKLPSQEQNGPVFDISDLDAVEFMDLKSLTRLAESVHDPITEIIDKTFSTGTNTDLLISFCNRIKVVLHDSHPDIKSSAYTVIAAIKALTDMTEEFSSDHKPSSTHYPKYSKLVDHLFKVLHLRLKLVQGLIGQVEEIQNVVDTLLKVLGGLLADQKIHGSEIKVGVPGLRYAATCKAINAQWVRLKWVMAVLLGIYIRIESVEELMGEARLIFVHSLRGGQLVLGQEFDDLDEAVRPLILIEGKGW